MRTPDGSNSGLRQRVEYWSERLNVAPRRVRVRHMTRKWGSCSTAGTITLARDLDRSGRWVQGLRHRPRTATPAGAESRKAVQGTDERSRPGLAGVRRREVARSSEGFIGRRVSAAASNFETCRRLVRPGWIGTGPLVDGKGWWFRGRAGLRRRPYARLDEDAGMWFDTVPFDKLRAGSSADSGLAHHERAGVVRGGPLTDFRRGRRNLPLPQERGRKTG